MEIRSRDVQNKESEHESAGHVTVRCRLVPSQIFRVWASSPFAKVVQKLNVGFSSMTSRHSSKKDSAPCFSIAIPPFGKAEYKDPNLGVVEGPGIAVVPGSPVVLAGVAFFILSTFSKV